jgi:hypothetical protein
MALAIAAASPAMAGGLLTNTNQNVAFNRNFARDGVIGIDGVYSNPAGVAFLDKGFHLSLNIQNIYQTRTIESGITVPSLQGTPYYQPFKLNGGDENGVKRFKGKASVPVFPTFQAALNYEHWGFQLGGGVVGGGGKATFNNGLGSFERSVSMVPASLYSQGIAASDYSVSSYISGQQYVYGVQFGATYKFNEHFAVYGGARFDYVYNKYEGSITGISATINGVNENLYNYFNEKATQASQMAANYQLLATENASNAAVAAQYQAAAAQYEAGAEKLNQTKAQFADKYLDCTQTGWGVTPIIGANYKGNGWNIGARMEFNTHLNIENNTKRDDTGLFADGVNTPNDLPGLLTIGGQYDILKNWRVMGSWHYYFDKSAKMANDKQKLLDSNTQEYLFGTEVDITKDILVSAGGQLTRYGLGDGAYLSDMSFVTSSYSIGFGAKFKVAKNMAVNVAYFFTDYEYFDKAYDSTISGVAVQNTDRFTRTNKVLGVGLDIDF